MKRFLLSIPAGQLKSLETIEAKVSFHGQDKCQFEEQKKIGSLNGHSTLHLINSQTINCKS